jgi:hypothetical protein
MGRPTKPKIVLTADGSLKRIPRALRVAAKRRAAHIAQHRPRRFRRPPRMQS